MRWIIDPSIRDDGQAGIEWARDFLARFDTSQVDWLRVDRGRERPGQRAPRGLYGRSWYPTGRGKARKGFRISCQVPGPWPFTVHLRLPPVYVNVVRHYGSRPDVPTDRVFQIGSDNGRQYWDIADVPRPENWTGQGTRESKFNAKGTLTPRRDWWTVGGSIVVNDLSEAIVWIVGHEAFHFLRKSRQVAGRNVEHEADAAGNAALADYRRNRK